MSELSLPSVESVARQGRQRMKARITETFDNECGGQIVALGSSMVEESTDFFSDVDTWVFVEDETIDEVLASRQALYASVAPPLITWERPRFAPVGGVHSVVLYDSPGLAPAEVDYYLAPTSKLQYYDRFIKNPSIPSSEFEWKTEPDDASVGAQLDYVALVTMWATKYWYRDNSRDEQLDWAMRRYESARTKTGLPELKLPAHLLGTTAVFSTIIENVHNYAAAMDDARRMRACAKIGRAVEFVTLQSLSPGL